MYKLSKIHMVGIGGAGMSGIAEVLHNLGYKVSGSDISQSYTVKYLKKLGINIYIGHEKNNVGDANIVVYSSAIDKNNPEIQASKAAMIPVISRAEMLAELMRLKYGIVIAGAHGKTSTTSMIASILAEGGIDPTIVVGGRLDSIGSTAKLGQGKFLVAEADESDGSFLKLIPTIAVVTNIDKEHLDFYDDIENIKESFLQFVNKVPFYGLIALCLDDENVQEIIPRIEKRFLTFGLSTQANIQARDIKMEWIKSSYELYFNNNALGTIELTCPGEHNIYNSLAAITVALELDIPFAKIKKALFDFKGADRRFQIKGEINNIIAIDDYAHHPTEIKATLKAAKIGSNRRLVVVFQPHRYTRTKNLLAEFATAFYEADIVILTNIYSANESPIPGISAKLIEDSMKNHGQKNVHFVESLDDIPNFLINITQPGDLVLTLGAGNIWIVADNFLIKLSKL